MNIKYEDFKNQLLSENIIGKGAAGIVYKIHIDKNEYAVKEMDINTIDNEGIRIIENEANILTKINHENIVKYYNSTKSTKSYYFIMEYCKNPDLSKFIKSKKDKKIVIDKNVIYSIVLDICLGIKEIHNKNIIHRDLKPENILINQDYKIKISDFGIAKELIGTIHAHTANMGTPFYMAPELITCLGTEDNEEKKECKYDNKVDIWSLGCIIYELCALKECFDITQIMNKSYRYKRLENNKEFEQIIDKLLKINPDERPNIDKVIELINNLNITNFNLDEKYFNSLDNISQNIIKRNKLKSKNQITIIIKVNQKDISKEIYFLENDYYLRNNKSYKFDNNNKEIEDFNENNIELYINDQNKTKNFAKFFIPKKEGKYVIKIIFKKKMTDCRYMFRNCDNIESVDLSSFDSSDVNNMNYMFGKCHYLEEVNLNNLVTDKVTDMSYMFNKCRLLKKLNFPESFNTKNVEKMNFMFNECQDLSEIKFSSSFVTNNVTTMRSMFKGCFNLKNLDLTNFTTEKLIDMGYMFNECINLEKITLNKEFKTNQVTNMIYLFNKCENLKEINLSGESQNLSNINLSTFHTENVEFLDYMFCDCKEIKNLDLSSFNIKETINMTNMFKDCGNLENLDISSFKNINNSKTSNMFDNLESIKKINVSQDSLNFLTESFNNLKESFISNIIL